MKKYISYKDDDEKETIRNGFFEILEETDTFIKFKTGENIVKIPLHRILKTKERA